MILAGPLKTAKEKCHANSVCLSAVRGRGDRGMYPWQPVVGSRVVSRIGTRDQGAVTYQIAI